MKKERMSIDDATPEEWDESARMMQQLVKKNTSTSAPLREIPYKYNELALIDEFKAYVDATYSQHYSKDKFQATEFIIDGGHGTGFCIGNGMKYLQRYGKKGESPDDWRKDLMKVLHYTLIQLYIHDEENR